MGDEVWVSSAEKLYRLNTDGDIQSYDLPAELMQTPIYDLYWSKDRLHIAAEAGFFHLEPDGTVKQCELPDKNNTAVYKLLKDSRGNNWISAHRKLFHKHQTQDWQHITGDELGSYPWFSDIFEDKDQNIWLASFSDGLYRASSGNIRRIVADNADPVVRSVAVSPDDKLLLAGQSDVGELDAKGHYHKLLDASALGASTIHDVFWPSADEMWLATDRGVQRWQRGQSNLSAEGQNTS